MRNPYTLLRLRSSSGRLSVVVNVVVAGGFGNGCEGGVLVVIGVIVVVVGKVVGMVFVVPYRIIS
jgi:hypothetical protein